MRKKIVAGNWKMNTLLKDGMELAKAVEKLEKEKEDNDDKKRIALFYFSQRGAIEDCRDGVLRGLAAAGCCATIE